MKKKNDFPVITTAHLDSLLQLPQQDRNELITAILFYAKDKTISELTNPLVEYLFYNFKQDFDEREDKYNAKCERLRSIGSRGGTQKVANATKCYQMLPNATNRAATADASSPSPNINKIIKEEIINNEVNYLSDSTTNVVGHLNNNNILTPYNPPSKESPPFLTKGGAMERPPLTSAKNEEKGLEAPPSPPKVNHAKILNHWNTAMQGKAIRPIKGISGQRLRWLQARLNEYGEDAILQATDKAAASGFLNGDNNKGWIATFDWFVRPNNFPKVLEGNYDNHDISKKTEFDPDDPYRNGNVMPPGQVSFFGNKDVELDENGWPIR